ncbi:MAG: TIM barrel protein [Planctomycetota bacterium]
MILPGLVSITFRKLPPERVCRLAADNGLAGIEWGGDVHVPAGDTGAAARVAGLTRDHGLAVAAYGSYYRLGVSDPAEGDAAVKTAASLGAPVIRVWCGNVGSADADEATRRRVVEDARRVSGLAADAGLTVACEWHGKTLTDRTESAVGLLREVDHPAFKTYWQPHQRIVTDDALADLDAALPWVVGLHVFQWHAETVERQALTAGGSCWPRYLKKARSAGGKADPMYALLEFVRDDDPANLPADAATLRRWLGEANA